MLALGVATLFLLTGVFVVQALVTDYYLVTSFHLASFVFVGTDVLLLFYMLSSVSLERAATRGGITWLIYSWTLLGKLVLFYWFLFDKPGTSLHKALVFNWFRLDVILFLTPVLYAILGFRSARLLYGSTGSSISLESMLHADMVVHVTMDLLDLMIVFRLAEYDQALVTRYSWLRILVGVLIVVGFFMHSYSFPTTFGATAATQVGVPNPTGLTSKNQQQGQYSLLNPHQPSAQGDIFLTRKHAALVAMFLVDIPLLFIRIFLWVTFPEAYGFTPIIVKNVLFIPLQAFRLNQCRLAEKERAKSTQKKTFHTESRLWSKSMEILRLNGSDDITTSPSNGSVDQVTNAVTPGLPSVSTNAAPSHRPARLPQMLRRRHKRTSVAPNQRSNSSSHPGKKAPRDEDGGYEGDMQHQPRVRSLSADSFRNRQLASTHNPSSKPFFRSQPSYALEAELYSPNNASEAEDSQGRATGDAQQDSGESRYPLTSPRVPDIAATSDEVTPKKLRRLLAEVNSVRRIPVKGFRLWSLLVRIFHCMRLGGRRGLASLLDDTFVLSYWKQIRLTFPLLIAWASQIVLVCVAHGYKNPKGPWAITVEWDQVPNDYRWFLFVGGANVVLMFSCWFVAAPILDVVFITVFWVVRLAAFFITLVTVRDTNFLEIQHKWELPIETQPILLWGFLVLPCFRLLDALFPIQSAFLGRKYMYYFTTSSHRKLQASLISTVSSFDDPQLERVKHNRVDEAGWITTSSLLVFLNCRHALAPASFGELLIGPDLIKDVRLMDMLVLRGWLETVILLILHCVVLQLFNSFVSLGVFAGHLLMFCIYNIVIQAIRLLALRRYEVKLAFEEIVRVFHRNDVVGKDKFFDKSGWVDAENELEDDRETDVDTHSGTHRGHHPRRAAWGRPLPKGYLISLLNAVERHQRQGFFTSPGELFPSFC